MDQLFERSYSDEISAKDGGFIFQAILNYDLSWAIINGETVFDQKDINGRLNQVDLFPDMKFESGYATLTYVILSEVNLLKRKFELASEAIKRLINPEYAREMAGEIAMTPPEAETEEPNQPLLLNKGQDLLPPAQENKINEVVYNTELTSEQIRQINAKYFKGTVYQIKFTAGNIVLREVSTSGLDTGAPNVTLKLSTGMVDTLDGQPINSWDNFKVQVTGGNRSFVIDNSTDPKISTIQVYDPIENMNELIFRTILPSLVLEFKGDRVQIDTYSNRSSQVTIRSNVDFDNLFNIDEAPKTEVEEPEEGESIEQTEEK
jgi:hypothetical protein